MQAAVFLDRDGTLNVDRHYVVRREDFDWIPGAVDGLRHLYRAGFALVVVTNQSAIGRGMASQRAVEDLHAWMLAELAAAEVPIAGVYYCPHLPTAKCNCRKPSPGLLQKAAVDLDLDLARSWMIGDKPSDVAAGRAAGVGSTILLRPDRAHNAPRHKADYVCEAISDTVPIISAHHGVARQTSLRRGA